MEMKVAVVAVTSTPPVQPYYCYQGFIESLKRLSIPPHIVAVNELGGLGRKPFHLLNYIEHGGLAGYTHAIVTDAWDVLFVDNLDVIMGKYRDLGCEVMFNAENNCFPFAEWGERFPATGTPYRYLNSGFYIGTVEHIVAILTHIGAKTAPLDYKLPNGTWKHFEDQSPMQQAFFDQPVKIGLDIRGNVCNCLGGATPDQFVFTTDGRCKNAVTDVFPSVWHANGGGKTTYVFERIRKMMGL